MGLESYARFKHFSITNCITQCSHSGGNVKALWIAGAFVGVLALLPSSTKSKWRVQEFAFLPLYLLLLPQEMHVLSSGLWIFKETFHPVGIWQCVRGLVKSKGRNFSINSFMLLNFINLNSFKTLQTASSTRSGCRAAKMGRKCYEWNTNDFFLIFC
jgi:hypothetical protein